MSFYRPSLFRADPFFSSPFPSITSPTLFSPLSSSSLFDPFPALTPVSAPLYSLYTVGGEQDESMDRSSRTRHTTPSPQSSKSMQHKQLTEDKWQDKSTAARSPSPSSSATPATSSSSPASTTSTITSSTSPTTSTTTSTASPSASTSPHQQRTNSSGKVMTTSRPARSSLFAPMPSLLSSALSPLSPLTSLTSSLPSMDMSLDMSSTPSAYSIDASVPGVDKSDIRLTLDDGQLTIEAVRREHKGRRPAHNDHNDNNTTSSSSSTPTQPRAASEHKPVDVEHKDDSERDNNNNTAADNNSSNTAMSEADNTASSSTSAPTTSPSSGAANITADSSTDSTSHADDMGDEVTYHHVESFYGRVVRRVQLPEDAITDQLTAKYEDGVIHITLPRQQQQQRKQAKHIQLQ